MLAVTIISGGVVLVELVAFNPSSLGPVGVTIWFLALLTALQGAFTLGLYRMKQGLAEVSGPATRFMSSWRQGSLIAGVLVVMLALSSLRQLSGRDIGLLVVLALLVEFYGRTRK